MAATVAIAVFVIAAIFGVKAFQSGLGAAPESRELPRVECPADLPKGAIPVVSCDRAAQQAEAVASFVTDADGVTASWREYPGSFEGQTIPSWLITIDAAEFAAGTDGCTNSGSVPAYTVVVSATSGERVASDGAPEGCSTNAPAPLVELPTDPCSILTDAQIETATSSTVSSKRVLNDSDLKVPGPPYPCDYQAHGRFGHIGVVSEPNDRQGYIDALNRDPVNREVISGLGDGGFNQGGSAIVVAVGDGYFSIGFQFGGGTDAENVQLRLANDALQNLADQQTAVPAPPSLSEGGSPTSTSSSSGISVTKAATLDVSSLGGLQAAEEAYGSLWLGVVTDTGGTEVVRIDPETGATQHTFPIQGWSLNEWGGNGIAIGGGMVWIPGLEDGQATITRIDPATNGANPLAPAADGISSLTFGSEGTLWANIHRDNGTAIAQIDPGTGEIIETWPYTADWAREICEVQGNVWVHEMSASNSTVHGGRLSQVVPGTASQVETGGTFSGQACSKDAVWTAINGDEKAVNLANGIGEVDSASGAVIGSWSTPPIGYDIALDGVGGVWFLTSDGDAQIERLDPSTGDVNAKESVRGTPIFISSSTDHIWVGTYEGQLVRFDIEPIGPSESANVPSPVDAGDVCGPGEQPMITQPLTVHGYETIEAAVKAALSWVGVTTSLSDVQQGMSVSTPDSSGEIHVTIYRMPMNAARSDHVYLSQGSDGLYFVETLAECQATHSP